MIKKIKEILSVKEEGIGTFNLFLFGTIIFIAIFSISQFINEKIIQIGLDNSLNDYVIGENLFVDQNLESITKKGSPNEPFGEISEALNFISEETKIKNIYVKPGNYLGNFEIPKNINLFAPWPETYILNNSLEDKTLVLKGNNIIKGFTIKGGGYGIYIPKEANLIKLNNCKIQNANWFGVYNEDDDFSENYKLEIINSEISNNKQGLYIQKSSFLIKNSQISNNKENGIEADLGNLNLIVQNSIFKNNGLNGINFQPDFENSVLKIENNLFESNRNAGINCIKKSVISPSYFSDAFEISPIENNQFENNSTAVGPNCLR